MLSRNKRRHKDTYDKDISIIHTVVTTPANVHDVTKIDELRRPDDWEVFSKAGYLGMGKRESADPARVRLDARSNTPFIELRFSLDIRKSDIERLAKNTARLTMLASIANMFIGNCFENRTKVSFA